MSGREREREREREKEREREGGVEGGFGWIDGSSLSHSLYLSLSPPPLSPLPPLLFFLCLSLLLSPPLSLPFRLHFSLSLSPLFLFSLYSQKNTWFILTCSLSNPSVSKPESLNCVLSGGGGGGGYSLSLAFSPSLSLSSFSLLSLLSLSENYLVHLDQ